MNSPSEKDYYRYVALIVLLFFIQAGIIAWVDPYQILPFTLSDHEKYYSKGDRVEKAARLRNDEFDNIILGSSRVQVGIDPSHEAFSDTNTYNMAMSAIDVTEYAKLLDYLQQHQNVKRLYMGLDFDSFAVPVPEPAREAFRVNYDNSLFNGSSQYALHLMEYLLSSQTFFYSIANIVMPDYSKTNVYSDAQGFMDKSILHLNHREIFRAEMISRYTRAVFSAYDYDSNADLILKDELTKLALSDVDVVLFIPPVHGLMLEIFEKLDLYPVFEQWKRNLVAIVEQVNQEQNVFIKLWDFTGNASISMEPIPSIDEGQTRMAYFFEFSHFKKNVGDMMIEAMAGNQDSDIGQLIDVTNINEHLLQVRHNRKAFRQQFPQELLEIDALYDDTLCERAVIREFFGKPPKLKTADSLDHCPE